MQYFKDFDKQYAHLENTLLEGEDLDALLELAGTITKWGHSYFQPSPGAVQEAVYNTTTANAWQQFRVSLKGQPTSVKLARLEARWNHNTKMRSSLDQEFQFETTRIMNYIGALKRGGLLNDNLEIIR